MAASFEHLTMTLFAVILMINVGIMANDSSTTEFKINAGQSLGGTLSFEDLNAQFQNIPERTTSDDETCNNWICSTVDYGSSLATDIFWGLGLFASFAVFLLSNFNVVVFGFYYLLVDVIAGNLEMGFGPIHLLFTGIASIFYLMAGFGLYSIVKSIASIGRGGGG